MSVLATRRQKARAVTFTVVPLAGAVAFGVSSDAALRASISFLGGVLLAYAAFGFGAFNIKLADRLAPRLTMVIALFSYALTAVALGLILAAASPRVVHSTAIAVGLLVGLVLWVGFELATAITRPEARSGGA